MIPNDEHFRLHLFQGSTSSRAWRGWTRLSPSVRNWWESRGPTLSAGRNPCDWKRWWKLMKIEALLSRMIQNKTKWRQNEDKMKIKWRSVFLLVGQLTPEEFLDDPSCSQFSSSAGLPRCFLCYTPPSRVPDIECDSKNSCLKLWGVKAGVLPSGKLT
jgi:hypothetical protein